MILGFISILLMGITLGLLGAGGSILTVPILVYLFKINPVLSTSYSLLLVGFTALIGAFLYFRKKQIDFSIAIKFAIPSIITVYLTRRFLLPAIPYEFAIIGITIQKDLLILLLFALIMFLTSIFMIKNSSKAQGQDNKMILLNPHIKNILIIIESSLVGVITAIIGAGGGFLIVPALVLLNKANIKTAIGTSLLIIAAKSILGFVGDVQAEVDIDYFLAIKLIVLASIGMFSGALLSKYLNPNNLKKSFGYFVMITSILIIIKEIIL
ncbi:sulfite exporter TauE/SafE family protein [Rickettsiales bacterium]|nr:sulfite exporter TauE/SafE family protein [Rickettsiales bacterium]